MSGTIKFKHKNKMKMVLQKYLYAKLPLKLRKMVKFKDLKGGYFL
jgi:hypothetical protein